MAAPKGNQFWKLAGKAGRKRLFQSPEVFWKAACEYFEWCDANPWVKIEQVKQKGKPYYDNELEEWVLPPDTIEIPTQRPYGYKALCLFIGAGHNYLTQFKQSLAAKGDNLSDFEKEFSVVLARVEDIIYTQKYEGAVIGAFNPMIISRDLGLAEKTESTVDLSATVITKEQAREISDAIDSEL